MSYGRPAPALAYASFEGAAAYTRPAFGAADAEWTEPASISGKVAAATPLGAVLLRGTVDAQGYVQAASMLGAVALLGEQATFGFVAAAGPLSLAAAALAVHDFTGALPNAGVSTYTAVLTTPGGPVTVPISSWQATLRVDEQSYVQCVVPAVQDLVDDITTATAFEIRRTATLADGALLEYVMCSSPLDTVALAQGKANYTATLSGYASTGFVASADPDAAYDRTLTGIRTVFTYTSGVRIRASIDWLLKPGQRAIFGATSFVVGYINYYVGGGDAYMDVGEAE